MKRKKPIIIPFLLKFHLSFEQIRKREVTLDRIKVTAFWQNGKLNHLKRKKWLHALSRCRSSNIHCTHTNATGKRMKINKTVPALFSINHRFAATSHQSPYNQHFCDSIRSFLYLCLANYTKDCDFYSIYSWSRCF